MTESVDKWITKKTKEISDATAYLNAICGLYKQFDDLSFTVDRWNETRWHSNFITSLATNVEIRHSCGCCDDAPIFARPYVVINGIEVYSPLCFCVGEKAYGGEKPYDNWKKELIDAKIQQCILDKLEAFFETNRLDESEYAEDQ
jgi:hypothetical protein